MSNDQIAPVSINATDTNTVKKVKIPKKNVTTAESQPKQHTEATSQHFHPGQVQLIKPVNTSEVARNTLPKDENGNHIYTVKSGDTGSQIVHKYMNDYVQTIPLSEVNGSRERAKGDGFVSIDNRNEMVLDTLLNKTPDNAGKFNYDKDNRDDNGKTYLAIKPGDQIVLPGAENKHQFQVDLYNNRRNWEAQRQDCRNMTDVVQNQMKNHGSLPTETEKGQINDLPPASTWSDIAWSGFDKQHYDGVLLQEKAANPDVYPKKNNQQLTVNGSEVLKDLSTVSPDPNGDKALHPGQSIELPSLGEFREGLQAKTKEFK